MFCSNGKVELNQHEVFLLWLETENINEMTTSSAKIYYKNPISKRTTYFLQHLNYT